MVTVQPDELRLMLFSTFRYSLGRQTYMPSCVQEWVRKYHHGALSSRDLEQLAEEIDERVRAYGGEQGLGSDFDAQDWRRFQAWCRREAKKTGETP